MHPACQTIWRMSFFRFFGQVAMDQSVNRESPIDRRHPNRRSSRQGVCAPFCERVRRRSLATGKRLLIPTQEPQTFGKRNSRIARDGRGGARVWTVLVSAIGTPYGFHKLVRSLDSARSFHGYSGACEDFSFTHSLRWAPPLPPAGFGQMNPACLCQDRHEV